MRYSTIALSLALAAVAGQATALSCMRPDPIASFQNAAEAEESYFVLYGTLTFDESALPESVGMGNRPEPVPIPAEFTGKGLSQDGFVNDYAGPITLQPTCAGSWCGGAKSGVEAVFFVQVDDVPTVVAGPCGGKIFENPSPAVLDALTTCMQGGECSAQALQ